MNETPQQYIRRILGYLGKQDPLKVMRATPSRIERLIEGLSRAEMKRRPAPGKWSIAEIVAHLADAEILGGYRFRQMLGKNGIEIQAMDQNAWAEAGRYGRVDPKESLDVFRAIRSWNLRLLTSVPRKSWSNYGMHAERGRESVSRLVHFYGGHDLNHMAQIRAIMEDMHTEGSQRRSKRNHA